MLVRAALLLAILGSSAEAAPFEDLKADLSSCLRFEMDGTKSPRSAPLSDKARWALQRCAVEAERLDRADGRRLRGDGGLSPSTRSVIQGVFGRSDRARFTSARF